MQRVLMLLACVCGCSFAGLRIADRLRRRATALRSLRTGIQSLTSAVAHTNRTLSRIAGEIAAREQSQFWRLFGENLSSGGDAGGAWCTALEAASARGGQLDALTQRDRAILISFSTTLGKTDRLSQAENGRVALEALSALIEGADEVYAQKGRVYRVLGLFLGLGLGILLW